MSAVKVVNYTLSNNATLIAAVPAANIFTGFIPIDTELPALCVNHISSTEITSVATTETKKLATSRVQVTVQAKTYSDQKAILDLVRKALPNTRGTVNSVEVDSILPDGAGPDMHDADAQIFMQSRDFIVRFAQS